MGSQEAADAEAVEMMNARAPEIADAIERELRRMMPLASGITAQAEVGFRSGSLVMEGTVVLLSWVGGIALDAARDQLASLIKVAVRRAMAAALPPAAGLGAMDVAVRPEIAAASEAAPLARPASAPQAALTPVAPSAPQAPAQSAPPQSALRSGAQTLSEAWALALVGVLTALVLLLLADRLFRRPASDAVRHNVLVGRHADAPPPPLNIGGRGASQL